MALSPFALSAGTGGSGSGNKRRKSGGSAVQILPKDLANPMKTGTVFLQRNTVKEHVQIAVDVVKFEWILLCDSDNLRFVYIHFDDADGDFALASTRCLWIS